MHNITCIIIEDEPLAMQRNINYVQQLPCLQLVGTFSSALAALQFLQTTTVQLIFLDINLGQLGGIEMLETKNIFAQIIIITAYQEYAVKGYELNVTDYLLKPFTFERFTQAVAKVQQKLLAPSNNEQNKIVFIKTAYKLEKVLLQDVLYIEGMRDYRKIVLLQKPPIMTLQTFTALSLEIPSNIICRVHKSYMVAISKIDAIQKDQLTIQQQTIPISDTYKKTFFAIIQHLDGYKNYKN